jgi:mannitol-specific phosphotransferase system IIBC component
METKVKTIEKEFDTVKTFRAIKDKISKDISQMTLEQIKEYLQKQKLNTPVSI